MAIRASHVDEMMAARREKEEQVNALKDYSAQNTKLGFAAKQEIDITSRRRKEHLARVQAEERMHAMIQESEYVLYPGLPTLCRRRRRRRRRRRL